MNIKKKIQNTLAIAFIAALFVFAFTWIIFDFQESSNSLKDTWTIVSSLFSGISTLAAAYIASLLFNDWRDAQRFSVAKDVLVSLIKLKAHIDKNHNKASYYSNSYNLSKQLSPPEDTFILNRINEAKNCQNEKEEYKLRLNILLIDFYEKSDIFKATLNITLFDDETRGSNLSSYAYFVSSMYTNAYEGNLANIEISNLTTDKYKEDFEIEYKNIIEKLKANSSLE